MTWFTRQLPGCEQVRTFCGWRDFILLTAYPDTPIELMLPDHPRRGGVLR
jgi:hypothetical protein